MKGLAVAALAVAIALPACAQHGGGGHASFGGRGAPVPAFHGGFAPSHSSFAPSGPFHYTGSAIAHAPVSYPSSMRLPAPGVRYPTSAAPINRPNFYHPGHGGTVTTTHNFYIRTYPVYPYAYAYPSYVYGYLPSDLVDDSFNNDDTSQQPQPEPQPDYGSAYPQPMPQPDGSYAQPMLRSPSTAMPIRSRCPKALTPCRPDMLSHPDISPTHRSPMPAAPQMQYVPGSATTVILIYKDGRPPEQIQNYLATRSTLTILDGGRRREVPLSDLNLPATISANRQTGVDFQLPTATP